MKEEAENNLYSLSQSNEGYNHANVISIRLNTEPIIDQIHHYLRGTAETVEVQDGQPLITVIKISNSKANEEGIHAIMGWLRGVFNTQVVQGNFDKDDRELNDYLMYYRKDLASFLMENLYNYDIRETDYQGIIDMIMSMIKPFLTRTIGDGERKSYSSTIKHSESSSQTTNNRGNGLGWRIPGMG